MRSRRAKHDARARLQRGACAHRRGHAEAVFNRNITKADDFADSYLDIAQVTEICHPLDTQLICDLLVRWLNLVRLRPALP